MSYSEFMKNTRSVSFNKNLTDFLSAVKRVNSYNNGSLVFTAAILPLFTNSFNSLMNYYVNNETEREAMDADFGNVFSKNMGKYININLNQDSQNINWVFSLVENYKEKFFPIIYPSTDTFFGTFFKGFHHDSANLNLILGDKTFSIHFAKGNYYSRGDESNKKTQVLEHLKNMFDINHTSFVKIFQLGLYQHTNKLRDLLLSLEFTNVYLNLFYIPDISTYSKLYLKDFISSSYNFADQDLSTKLEKNCNNLKYYDKELLNELIINFSTIQTSNGFFKDLDAFNIPSLSILQNAFDERFGDIDKDNLVKLRILRNIAADRGIQLNYVDERASVNSLTDKKLLIFSDKVNCEVIVIDTKTLISRFSSRQDTNCVVPIKTFFKFLKADKIFDKILVSEGKRTYSHILTVFCEKGKKHTEEALEQYSAYFEEAMFLSSALKHVSDDNFYQFLEQAKRAVVLKDQLTHKEQEIVSHKNKI